MDGWMYSLQYHEYLHTDSHTQGMSYVQQSQYRLPQFPPLGGTTRLWGIALDPCVGTVCNIANIRHTQDMLYVQQSQYCLLATLVPASQQHHPSFGSCDPQLWGIHQTRALVRFAISQILAYYIAHLRHAIYIIVVILLLYNLSSYLLVTPLKFQFF